MAKSKESYSKKEIQKNKQKKRQDKNQRREERKTNAKPGKTLEEMMAYVDEYGNITSTPPDNLNKTVIREEDIEIGARNQGSSKPDVARKGTVTFFNESKGYGFIKDSDTQESIFVHVNALLEPIKEKDKVAYEVTAGPKGLSAIKVKRAS